MTRTLSHELLHYIKAHSKLDGQNLQDFALEMLKQTEGYNLEERVKQKIEQYARNGVELTEEEALEEIAADSMLTVLQNEQLLEQILAEEPTLFEKLKNFIHSLIEELKRMAAGLKNPEARAMLKQEQEMLDMLAAMFDAAAIKAKENAAQADGDAGVNEEERKAMAFSARDKELDEESKAFYKQFPSTRLKLKNISEYSAEELNRVKGYLSSVDEGLLEFAKKIQNGEAKPSDKYQMGLVPEKLMKKINELLGYDLKNYRYEVAANSVKHVKKRQGEKGKANRTMADANDFARIHYVLEHFDYIDPETRFSRGYAEFDPILNKIVHSKIVQFSMNVAGNYAVSLAIPQTKRNTGGVVTVFVDTTNAKKQADSSDALSTRSPGDTPESVNQSVSENIVSQRLKNSNTSNDQNQYFLKKEQMYTDVSNDGDIDTANETESLLSIKEETGEDPLAEVMRENAELKKLVQELRAKTSGLQAEIPKAVVHRYARELKRQYSMSKISIKTIEGKQAGHSEQKTLVSLQD